MNSAANFWETVICWRKLGHFLFNRPLASVNIGVQKKFGENGGTLRLGYDDLLHTLRFSGESEIPELGQFYRASLIFEQPTLKISYSMNSLFT